MSLIFIINILVLSTLLNTFFNVGFCHYFDLEINWKIILAIFISSMMFNVLMSAAIIISLIMLLLASMLFLKFPWTLLKNIKNDINNS
jgi:hypothetical protein